MTLARTRQLRQLVALTPRTRKAAAAFRQGAASDNAWELAWRAAALLCRDIEAHEAAEADQRMADLRKTCAVCGVTFTAARNACAAIPSCPRAACRREADRRSRAARRERAKERR